MLVGNVTFKNNTGGPVSIDYQPEGMAGATEDVAAGADSNAISGRLLSMDVTLTNSGTGVQTTYSCDLTDYQDDEVLVDEEGPYKISVVLSEDGDSHDLVVKDDSNAVVIDIALSVVA